MKNALGLSLGICGAVWTYLALGILDGYALVWGGFIAWGCYFTNGKGSDNLQKTIVATVYGAVLAGVAVVIMGLIGEYTGSLAAPIAVGITVWGLTALADNKFFANIPANVFGYAGTFGLILMQNNMEVTSLDLYNPVLLMSVSFILGSIAGLVSEKVANAIG
jgi:hypothetical protein